MSEAATAVVNSESSEDALFNKLTSIEKKLDESAGRMDTLEKNLEEAKKVQYPHGAPGAGTRGAPTIRHGEDPMTSRSYSITRLIKALTWGGEFEDQAKLELNLAKQLQNHTQGYSQTTHRARLIPFATEHLPVDETKTEEGHVVPGYPVELVKECRDLFYGTNNVDPDQLYWEAKRIGIVKGFDFAKDLSASVATTGGTLVGLPAQGQLIDLLRPMLVFSQVGAQEITLPPQGSIRFPRDTGDPTVAGFGEGATITESTPSTGELLLAAKRYSALVDIPLELLKFSSIAVEAWLRRKMILRHAIQEDSDSIDGTGGTKILGIVNYATMNTVIATTTDASGDTLEAVDPSRLLATIETQNARMDGGFFFAMRPLLWQAVSHRRAGSGGSDDGSGPYLFNHQFVGGEKLPRRLEGYPVVVTTNVPANRVKTVSTLTLLLAGVGSSWMIGRAGVAEIDMTNSDASKFASGINTMRSTTWVDAGPEHPEEFGMIDDLLST